MDGAVFAVGGVAVGAVASGGVQAYLARADQRRKARSAARLLYMHLHGAARAVADLREARAWSAMITDWRAYGKAWERHSEDLATLNTARFAMVSAAFGCLDSLALAKERDDRESASQLPGTPPIFDPSDEILERYVTTVQAAERTVLRSSFRWWEWRTRRKALAESSASDTP